MTPLAQPGNPKPRMFRLPAAQRADQPARLQQRRPGRVRRQRQAGALSRASGGILGLNIGKNAATPIERAVDDYLIVPGRRLSARRLRHGQHLEPEHAEPARAARRRRARCPARGAAAHDAPSSPSSTAARVPMFVKIAPDLEPRRSTPIAATLRRHRDRRRHRHQHDARARRGRRPARMPKRAAACRARRLLAAREPRHRPAARCRSGPSFPIIGVGGVMTAADAQGQASPRAPTWCRSTPASSTRGRPGHGSGARACRP